MKCPECGKEIEGNWNYCPNCGLSFRKQSFSNIFKKVFNEVKREMGIMDKMLEKDIEAFDLSPFFRSFEKEIKEIEKPRVTRIRIPRGGSGFSIRITSGTGQPPRVSIKTFGDVDKEKLEKQVKEQLGVRQAGAVGQKVQEKGYVMRKPKTTEEPKADIRRTLTGLIVELELPDVKSEADIDVKELESSVEVKAMAGDKAYFKILTKPEQFHLKGKKFKDGKLVLEFA